MLEALGITSEIAVDRASQVLLVRVEDAERARAELYRYLRENQEPKYHGTLITTIRLLPLTNSKPFNTDARWLWSK